MRRTLGVGGAAVGSGRCAGRDLWGTVAVPRALAGSTTTATTHAADAVCESGGESHSGNNAGEGVPWRGLGSTPTSLARPTTLARPHASGEATRTDDPAKAQPMARQHTRPHNCGRHVCAGRRGGEPRLRGPPPVPPFYSAARQRAAGRLTAPHKLELGGECVPSQPGLAGGARLGQGSAHCTGGWCGIAWHNTWAEAMWSPPPPVGASDSGSCPAKCFKPGLWPGK